MAMAAYRQIHPINFPRILDIHPASVVDYYGMPHGEVIILSDTLFSKNEKSAYDN